MADPTSMISALRSATETAELRPQRPASANGGDFGEAIKNAIEKVDQLHVQADQEAAKQAAGAGNLHETALALEKADVALRLAVKVRNKAVEAYQEIMRMSV